MSPKHIKKIDEKNRRAVAPYNFIELPEKVVEAQPLPDGDRYHPTNYVEILRQTGRIECTLTTESPLYIRCGLTTGEFESGKETKDLPEFFYTDPSSKSEKPVIPGSSLRGMLRTLVEIVSFSKIDRVSGHQRLFFRAVGSNPSKESWGREYKQYVSPEKIKAGYLKEINQSWYIQPAMEDKGVTFAWVEEDKVCQLPGFKHFNDKSYEPQYFPVSYNSLYQKQVIKNSKIVAQPWFVSSIDLHQNEASSQLVTSGNMKQSEEDSPRCNHCVVFPQDKNAKPLQIDEKAIEHYCNALTDFQKSSPFDKDWGVLEENRPVFYCPPKRGNVGFFGQSPNFRIPYSPKGNGHATTVVDFIPEDLRKIGLIDLADAIFGWVKQETDKEKLPDGVEKQCAGRVFVTDAIYQSDKDGIGYENNPVTPQILASPKPTCFPHYLVQPEENNPDTHPSKLKHYASKPVEETVIRGHKLYWHKGSNPDFKLPTPPKPKKVIDLQKKVLHTQTSQVFDTQTTLIKPTNKGVTFKFDIHFENLSDVELGALLWVLDFAKDDAYRLKLGMGKPLGLGAVKIEPALYLSSRQERYQKLFDCNESWEIGETESSQDMSDYVSRFESYMLEKLNHTGVFKNLCRIKMLLVMLSWPGIADVENNSRYMEIKREREPRIGDDPNEYKQRPVLPEPLDIMREATGIKRECDYPTQKFSEGQIVDAKVTDIKQEQIPKGKKSQLKTTITYEIEGSSCPSIEEVNKKQVFLKVDDFVKVIITRVQGTNIRKVSQQE